MIHTFDPLADPRWNRFVSRQPRASIYHSDGWLRALSQTYGYRQIAFTTTPPASELENSIVFSEVRSWMVSPRLVSLPFSDWVEPLTHTQEDLGEILDYLRQAQEKEKWKKIELRTAARSDEDSAFKAFQDGQRFVQQTIPLDGTLEQIFSNFHHNSIQRKIRRGEREGLTYAEGRSEAFLRAFYRLHVMTRKRHAMPPPSIQWFRNVLRFVGDAATIRTAAKGSEIVATVFTLRFGKTLVYKYGCTDERFHNLGSMPFLFWKTIEQAKREGAEAFDLGRSDTDNPGLIQFKERLGANRQDLVYKVFPAGADSLKPGSGKMKLARFVFGKLPTPAFVLAGRLIYPHLG